MVIHIYFFGVAILIGAIILNVLAKELKVKTWYDFLHKKKIGIKDALFLFLIYPFLLGLFAYLAMKII